MTAPASDRRERLRAMLADLKMPGAPEALDGVLTQVNSAAVTASEAIEQERVLALGGRSGRWRARRRGPGLPLRIYCDNGTEFVSMAMDR